MLQLYKKTIEGEDCHDYFDHDRPDVLWISLSTLLKHYANPFTGDPAKSYGNPKSKWYNYEGGPAAIQHAWDSFNQERRETGTSLHMFCENFFMYGEIPPMKSSFGYVAITKLEQIISKTYPDGLSDKRRFTVVCEKAQGIEVVPGWGLAGTPDLYIAEHEFNRHGIPTTRVFVDLLDYKQDKEIRWERDKWTKKLKHPLGEIDDLNGFVYALKMWTYWFMIRRDLINRGYNPVLRYNALLHYKIEENEWYYHDMPNWISKHASAMIKHYFADPFNKPQFKKREYAIAE